MKLWPVTTLAKSNMATLKKFDDDAISVNRDLILIFPIYGKFGATGSRIPDTWSVKHTFSLIVPFYVTKTENRTKKSLTQLSYYCSG